MEEMLGHAAILCSLPIAVQFDMAGFYQFVGQNETVMHQVRGSSSLSKNKEA